MQSHNQHDGDQHYGVWPNGTNNSPRSLTLTPELQGPYGNPRSTGSQGHDLYHYGISSEETAHIYAASSNYRNGGPLQQETQVSPTTIPYTNGLPLREHHQVDQVITHEGHSLSQEIAHFGRGIPPFQSGVAFRMTDTDDLLTIKSFWDFFDGTEDPTYIQGNAAALDFLSAAVRAGAQAQHREQEGMYYAYVPLETAIYSACHQRGIPIPSAEALCRTHHSSAFKERAETHATERYLPQEVFNNMMVPGSVNEDVMAVLLDLFMAAQPLSFDCHLGFVVLNRMEYPHAFLYPSTSKNGGTVAWIVCDNRQGFQSFVGMSPDPHLSPPQFINKAFNTPVVDRTLQSAPRNHLKRRRTPNDQGTPTRPPKIFRDTSAAVRASQTPYPSTYTAKAIYDHHASNLHYNNILKVGLIYSNADIIKKVQALPNNNQRLNSQSAVAKRIGTGCEWLADKFSIPKKVLRCAYDDARRDARINARPKKQVSDEEKETWKEACDAAISWAAVGGPLAPDVAARFGVEVEPEDAAPVYASAVARPSPPHDSLLSMFNEHDYGVVARVAFPGFGAPPPAPSFAPSVHRIDTPSTTEEGDLGGDLVDWGAVIDPDLYAFGWE